MQDDWKNEYWYKEMSWHEKVVLRSLLAFDRAIITLEVWFLRVKYKIFG